MKIWVIIILRLGRFLSVEFRLLFFLNGVLLLNVVSLDFGIFCREEFGSRVSNILFFMFFLLLFLFIILIKRIFFFIFFLVGICRLFFFIFRIFLVIIGKRIVLLFVLLVIILFRDKVGRVMYFLIFV